MFQNLDNSINPFRLLQLANSWHDKFSEMHGTTYRAIMQKKISSNFTFFYRIVFPLLPTIFFGPIAIGMGLAVLLDPSRVDFLFFNIAFSAVSLTLVILFWFVGSKFKEVWIDDGQLIVSSYFKKDHIPFRNIESVHLLRARHLMIRVKFHHPTKFGKSIMFATQRPSSFWHKGPHPTVVELNELILSNQAV